MSDYWFRELKDKLTEGTEMGKIGDVHINQFAGGKEKGLSVQLTSDKGDGYVQLTKDEAKALSKIRQMKETMAKKLLFQPIIDQLNDIKGKKKWAKYGFIPEKK